MGHKTPDNQNSIRLYELIKVAMRTRFQVSENSCSGAVVVQANRDDLLK
jgi:hypothetical protein